MSFFAPGAHVSGPRPFRRRPPRAPWAAPPDNWLPGMVATAFLIAQSENDAVTLTRIAVYPTGFSCELASLQRRSEQSDPPPGVLIRHPRGEVLLGIRYADGSEGNLAAPGLVVAGSGVLVFPSGGSGDEFSFRQTVWVTPLPPEGPVTFFAAVPGRAVEESSVTIDSHELLQARERAVRLWPDEPEDEAPFDFSDAPMLPTSGSLPPDPEDSERAIRSAFAQAFGADPSGSGPEPLAAVQDGAALTAALEQLRARHPMEAMTSRVGVGRVVFLDPVRAASTFQIVWSASGSGGFGPQLGYAVRESGEWKVARITYGRILGWAGVDLPPAPPNH
jgi:hypothetical protein